MGSAYLRGLGVLQDSQQAAAWFFKAAKQGDKLSQAKLGLLYQDAADTASNRIEAHKWFSLAAAQGDENAQSVRDDIALKMAAPELAEARNRARTFSDAVVNAERNPYAETNFPAFVEIQTVGIARPTSRPQPPANPAMKDGVPLTIYNAIAAGAVQKWPGNYEMQEYEIKNQIESYKNLHAP